MNLKTKLSLRYIGENVDEGLMDVYQAASNMIAFSEFVTVATKITYGEKAVSKTEVAGFGKGSFITDLVIGVGGPMASMFSAFSTDQLLEIFKEAFGLWKHLKGNPPAQVIHNDQGVTVTNNSGHIFNVRVETLNLVFSEKGGEAVERFVKEAIGHQGIDALKIEAGGESLTSVTKEEAKFFVPLSNDAPISENTVNMTLVLIAAVFQDGNKWKFSDGSNTYSVAIEDEEFIKRVDAGERFGKGDVFDVEMSITQTRIGGKINVTRSIRTVIDHREPSHQYDFLP
jgi:hypothetical protein